MELQKDTVQRPEAWVDRRWWDQEGMELAGARLETVAAGDGEGGSEGEEEER